MLTVIDVNAIIGLSGAVVVPVTALLLNYRGFASMDARFASMDNRFSSVERRLEVIERDLKDFYRLHAEVERDVARLKDHTGLK